MHLYLSRIFYNPFIFHRNRKNTAWMVQLHIILYISAYDMRFILQTNKKEEKENEIKIKTISNQQQQQQKTMLMPLVNKKK